MQTLSDWYYPLVPSAPEWALDWDSLMEHDWLQPLEGCEQDPVYHAEGDVATHTRMVCESLIELPEWRQLEALPRAIVFLGALLHDIGKPDSSQSTTEGRIGSPGHTKLGAVMARQILWRGDSFLYDPPPLAVREMVAHLVRYSGLPIWFWQKDDPSREMITASMHVRCDWLALMAEADCLGRQSNTDDDFPARVKYFREYAHELNCLSQPYQFASDHTRFRYFHDQKNVANFELFDDTEFEVILMSGLPGAGKDTWISENAADLPCISLDLIRRELDIDPEEPQAEVANTARKRARELLRAKTPFVWNATNITRTMRSGLIKMFADYKARVRIVYLEPASYVELLERNQLREDAALPEHVVERLADKLEPPDLTEAHRVDWILT